MGIMVDTIITEGRTRGFGGVESDFNRVGSAADKTEGKVGKLVSALGGMNMGQGAQNFSSFVSQTTNRLSQWNSLTSQAATEGARADEMLKAMMGKRGEGAKFDEASDFFSKLSLDAAMTDDDPLKLAAAGLSGFGMDAERVKGIMAGLIGQTRLYNNGLADTASLTSTAEAIGRAYGKGDVSGLTRIGITLTDEQIAKIKELKDAGASQAQRQTAMYEILKSSFDQYALSMTEGMSQAEVKANRLQNRLDGIQSTFGEGVNNARSGLMDRVSGMMGGLEDKPELVSAAGTLSGYAQMAGSVIGPTLQAAGSVAQLVSGWKALRGEGKGVADAADQAANSKRSLQAATLGDLDAESKKTSVAQKEGGAIMDVTQAALESVKGKKDLTDTTKAGAAAAVVSMAATLAEAGAKEKGAEASEEEAKSTEKATDASEEAEKQSVKSAAKALAEAAATGDLSAAQEELKNQVGTFGEERLGEFIDDPKAALAGWKSELGALKGQIKDLPTTARTAYNASALARPLSIAGQSFGNINAFGQGGGSLTMGGAAVSGALGAGAAALTYNDMQSLGYSQGQSAAYAGITGAITTGAAAFFPPARIFIAAAEGMGLAVDKLYSERLEKEATTGSGAENTGVYGDDMQGRLDAAMKARDHGAQAKIYEEMSQKARDTGDETSAQSFHFQAQSQAEVARRQGVAGTSENIAATRGQMQAEFDRAQKEIAARPPMDYASYLDGQRRQTVQAQGTGRYAGDEFEIRIAPIKVRDAAGREARRQADDMIRAAYG